VFGGFSQSILDSAHECLHLGVDSAMSQAGKAGCNGYQLAMRHPCQPEVIGGCLSLVLNYSHPNSASAAMKINQGERERDSTGALGDFST